MFDSQRAPTGKDFMNAPWLFAEAYKYRRLRECFSVSKYWQHYDVFFRQKVRIQRTNKRASVHKSLNAFCICTVRYVFAI